MGKLATAINEMDTVLEIRKMFNSIFPNGQMSKGVFSTNVKHGDANDLRGTQVVFMDQLEGDTNVPAGFQGFVQCFETKLETVSNLAQIIVGEGVAGTQTRTSTDSGTTWSAWA